MSARRSGRNTAIGLVATGMLVAGVLAGCTAPEKDRGLPEGLPSSVQVVDGTVSNAVKGKDKNWSFTVTVADADAQQAAVAKLKSEGFSEIGHSTAGETKTVAMKNGKTGINATLLLTKRDGKYLVVYNLVKV